MSMECYGVLWSAINCKLVYIDIYRLSLCLYSKLIFPDVVDIPWRMESMKKVYSLLGECNHY